MEMHKQILEKMDAKELAQIVCRLQNDSVLAKQELNRIRDEIITLARFVYLDEEWIKPSEKTENIARACRNRIGEAFLLISQGARLIHP